MYNNICTKCGYSFKSKSNRKLFCENCLETICPICKNKNSDNIKFGICKKCYNEKVYKNNIINNKRKGIGKCKKHNIFYFRNSHNHNNCPYCKEEKENKKDYLKTLPGYCENKRQSLLYCEKHGHYFGGNQKVHCPICIKDNVSKCDICGNNFIKTKRIKYNICDKCIDTLIGDKDGFPLKCKNCGNYYKTNHNFKPCPICNKFIVKKKCKICNCEFKSFHSSITTCPKCTKIINRSDSVKLYYDLMKIGKIKDKLLLLPIKNNFVKSEYLAKRSRKIKCRCCKREFITNSPAQKVCQFCFKLEFCPICKNYFVVLPKRDPKYCSRKCSTIANYNKGLNNNNNNKIKIIKNNIMFNKNNIKGKININELNYKDFENVAGVWYKYDKKEKIVLDVMLTKNIKKEYQQILKRLKNPTTKKYIELSKNENIEFYFYKPIKSWEEGLKLELELAVKTKAKYWSPAPGWQLNKINEI